MDIEKLKKLYSKNININQYLRKKTDLNEDQIVKLSYDMQTGSYIKNFNIKKSSKVLKNLIQEINSTNFKTLLDFGSGELTNFYSITKHIKNKNKKFFFACDLSFSRVYAGVNFLKKKNVSLKNKVFFINESYDLPFPDSSIDIVTTCHSVEPNKKFATNIIKELFRITKKKLILFEPDINLVKKKNYQNSNLIKKRFEKHNYVKNIDIKLKMLRLKFDKVEQKYNFNRLNPASIYLIKKNSRSKNLPKFINPYYKERSDYLKEDDHILYSTKTGDSFFKVNKIVLFNKNNIYIEKK